MPEPSRLNPLRANTYAETLLEDFPLVLGRHAHRKLRHHILGTFNPVGFRAKPCPIDDGPAGSQDRRNV